MEQRYVEEAAFEELKQKIEKICQENSLLCKLTTSDPIKLVVWPDMSMEGHMYLWAFYRHTLHARRVAAQDAMRRPSETN